MSKVAAIQMVSTHNVLDNLHQAEALIGKAAHQGAECVVLPENFAMMRISNESSALHSEKFGEGLIQDVLSALSKQYGISIVGGTILLDSPEAGRSYSSSLFFFPDGTCATPYHKIHLFDVILSDAEIYQESQYIRPGNAPVLIDTPIGPVGMSICYDVRFPELYRGLMKLGAKIFVVPSAFTYETGRAHWEVLLRARAIENLCYVIAPNQGGTHTNGRVTYGHSMIISPWGEVLAQADTGEAVIFADIDLQSLDELRMRFPVTNHMRLFSGNEDVL